MTDFGSCEAHRQEALAVHAALTRIVRHEFPGLDPDAALGTVLGPVEQGADSLDELERALALEEDLPKGLVADDVEATVDIWPRAVLSVLLGPAARQCGWDPATLWTRSMRGVVNERVRWRGGCTCGLEADRPSAQRLMWRLHACVRSGHRRGPD